MAGKKGQPVQLQTEINNDEEWEKLLLKDGLIVVDIYSDWCGPCLGMQANLKKLKLEIGGDMLQLAVAKSDGITQLERFRNKSEPTWMFLSKGKMVNLMFGADAPKLTRMIISELKKEEAVQGGQATERVAMEITELAEEEKQRYDAKEAGQREIRQKEEAKKAKELLERRTKECNNIIQNLPNLGTAIVFPSAKDKYKDVLNDLLDEAGLNIQQTDKVRLTEEQIKEMCYFSDKDIEFTESELEQLYENEALMLLFKVNARAEVENIDHAILQMIYGDCMKPPGSPNSAAKRLLDIVNGEVPQRISISKSEEHDQEHHEPASERHEEKPGDIPQITKTIWVPRTPFLRATCLRMFYPRHTGDFTIPEPEPTPDHIAVVFSFTKKNEVMQIVQDYPKEIMAYGFFTSEDPEEAKLIAKTVRKLEKTTETVRTFEEKLVLKVSKKKSEVVFAFAQLGPVYMSPNAVEGKYECEKFFPEGYTVEGEEEEPEPPKKKKTKKSVVKHMSEEGVKSEETGEFPPGEEDQEEREEGEEGEEEGELSEGAELPEGAKLPEGAELPGGQVKSGQCNITEVMLEELLFFADTKFPQKTVEDLGGNKLCFGLLFKRSSEALTGNIDEVVLQAVYGNSRKPPGDENSPSQKLKKVLEFKPKGEEPTEQEIFDNVLLGIWTPPNALTRGTILKLIFPTISGPFRMPDLKEIPLHVVMIYDSFKAKDVLELSEKYPGQIMNYGYFTSDIPGEAQLIAKTTEKFDTRTVPVTYEEKIVIQLAKEISECYMAFDELGPSYISKDVEVGETDSLYFFPADYNKPEVEIINFLKKKTKRKGKFGKIAAPQENTEDGVPVVASEVAQESSEINATTEAGVDTEAVTAEENEDDEEELLEGEGKESDEEGDLGNQEGSKNPDSEGNEANVGDNKEHILDIADKGTSPVGEN